MTVITGVSMMPPGSGTRSVSTNVGAKTYTCAGGAAIVVIPAHADMLEASGWMRGGAVGATAARPTTRMDGQPLHIGYSFLDTTLGYLIQYAGSGVWRNPITGAAV